MSVYIISFTSITRQNLNEIRHSGFKPPLSSMGIANIFEMFDSINDGYTEWTIDRHSGVKENDLVLFLCSASSRHNIGMLRSLLNEELNADEKSYINELCDSYSQYAGKIISFGFISSIPDTPDRIEYAVIKPIIGFNSPIPYESFKSFIDINRYGSMTRVDTSKFKTLVNIIKKYNSDFDQSLLYSPTESTRKEKDDDFSDTADQTINVENKIIENDILNLNLIGKERQAFINVRVNQGEYRKRLLSTYNHCCLCNISDERLLIASHIKPWVNSNEKEKVDKYNGLLLCPNHDKLFDNGLITFSDDKKIVISHTIRKSEWKDLNISEDMIVECMDGCLEYIKYHRSQIFIT